MSSRSGQLGGRLNSGSASNSLGGGGMDSFDAYDMINAPQFVDFEDFQQGFLDDHDEADNFFYTHREEDDYFVPIDNLVPSIQFLNSAERNNENNTKKVDNNSPLHALKNSSQLLNSLATSIPAKPVTNDKNMMGSVIPVHQFYDYENEENNEAKGKENGNSNSVPLIIKKKHVQDSGQNSPIQSCSPESLIVQLESLNLTMSDESDDSKDGESTMIRFKSSSGSEFEHLKELEVVTNKQFDLTEAELEHLNIVDVKDTGVTLEISEMLAPIPIVTSALENYREPNVRPYSIYVKSSAVGSEVEWNEEEEGLKAGDYSPENRQDKISEPQDCFYDFESHILSAKVLKESSHPKKNLRRVSSCSDIVKLVVPQERNVKVYGYMSHVGITIPKTPDSVQTNATTHSLSAESARAQYERLIKGKHCSSRALETENVCSTISNTNNKEPPHKMVQGKSDRPRAIRQSRSTVKQDHRYVSLAEAVNKFNRTPDRFHSASRAIAPTRAMSASTARQNGGNLITTSKRLPSPSPVRGRYQSCQKSIDSLNTPGDSVESTDQQKSASRSRISTQGYIKLALLNLPKRIEIKTTVPKPFKFHETRRRENNALEQDEFVFKARPVPMKIFQGPTGLKEKIEAKATSPQTPNFASDERIKSRHEKRTVQETSPVSSAPSRPISARMPTPSKVHSITLEPPKVTSICPFSFEERNKEALRKKLQSIQQEIEESAKIKEFHANPLPDFSKSGVPKRKPIECTEFVPFNLISDKRGALYQQNWKLKMESQLKEQEEQRAFYANPPSIIYKKPFEPDFSGKALVEPIDLKLNTEKRSQERERYEQALRRKQEQEEEHRRQTEIEQHGKRKEEETEKRKQLVHKPLPFRPMRAFQVKCSDKPLTEPQSPAFKPLPSQRRIFK